MTDSQRNEWIAILIPTFGLICWYCGYTLKGQEIHLDHIKPKHAGGTTTVSNLALSCCWCNHAKGPRTLYGFLSYLERIRNSESPVRLILNKLDTELYIGRGNFDEGFGTGSNRWRGKTGKQ